MSEQKVDIEALYKRYGAMVLRRCQQLLKDEHEAMDIMQNVFVQVIRKRENLSIEFPSSLLYRIATNLCLNRIRDNKKRPEAIGDEIVEMIACVDDEKILEQRSLLDKIFQRGPESTRTIAVLHYVDGMTLEEVAGEVKMSVSGVRKRLRLLKESVNELREVLV
ncbi:MAG: sigma-70 family RNA polymerase sigma factor [Fibrobacterales bacterium]